MSLIVSVNFVFIFRHKSTELNPTKCKQCVTLDKAIMDFKSSASCRPARDLTVIKMSYQFNVLFSGPMLSFSLFLRQYYWIRRKNSEKIFPKMKALEWVWTALFVLRQWNSEILRFDGVAVTLWSPYRCWPTTFFALCATNRETNQKINWNKEEKNFQVKCHVLRSPLYSQ